MHPVIGYYSGGKKVAQELSSPFLRGPEKGNVSFLYTDATEKWKLFDAEGRMNLKVFFVWQD